MKLKLQCDGKMFGDFQALQMEIGVMQASGM